MEDFGLRVEGFGGLVNGGSGGDLGLLIHQRPLGLGHDP